MDLIEVRRQMICDAEKLLMTIDKEKDNLFEVLFYYLSLLHPKVDKSLIKEVCLSEIDAHKDMLDIKKEVMRTT